jgi:hypothetical protein
MGVEIWLDTLWNCGSTHHVNMSTRSEAVLSFLRRYFETKIHFGRYLNNRWPKETRNFINDVSVLPSAQSMSPDSMRLTNSVLQYPASETTDFTEKAEWKARGPIPLSNPIKCAAVDS